MTDEELMLKYSRQDDGEAFKELYRRYSPRVLAYLKKHSQSFERADEVHQIVFLKLHRNKESYQAKFPFAPWLFTIVRNSMLDQIRGEKGREFPVTVESYDKEDERELPPMNAEEKNLLEKRYLEEWSFEQIAQEMKISSGAVRKRISRIIRSLRGQYE